MSLILPGIGAIPIRSVVIAGDPVIPFSAVVFLSGFAGADGSTAFVDESSYAHAVTTHGDAQVDVAASKFGGTSLLLDGGTDHLSCEDSVHWDFADKAFTVEAWVRVASLSTNTKRMAGLVGYGEPNGSNLSWLLRLANNPANGLIFEMSALGLNTDASVYAAFDFLDGAFHHVAADRDAVGAVRLYIDGVMVDKTIYAAALNNPVSQLKIGRTSISAFFRNLDGWLDEVRITKGYAQYGSDDGFAVPAAAFPRA